MDRSNVDNKENTYYTKELKKIKNTKIDCFKNVMDALTLIKKIKFSETNIIISGSLYSEFIENFEENLKNIFIIPKIIIFTSNIGKFIENNNNYNDNKISFYNLGGIHIFFNEVKNFLESSSKPINKNDIQAQNIQSPIPKIMKIFEEKQLTFEYIDCKEKLVLPLLYKSLIEITSTDNIEKYTEYLYNKYSINKEVNKLLKSIQYISDIPIELLSKYYARLYTIESQFYYDINKELRKKEKEKYLLYIKILYEGVNLKSLPLASNNILYRGSKISNDEIIKIKEFLKNKKEDLPGAIVFSKSFLSFSKDIKRAENFLNGKVDNENLFKVLYIIEKDDKIDYSLSTHCDIENISKIPQEKEVLFFPFSSFEIKDINEKIYNNEKIYEIKLLYLGKYLKEIENIDKKIPDSEFKKEMIESGLIFEKKMEKAKDIINHFKEFKDNINKKNSNLNEYNNEINITYNIENENRIRIFGEEFVQNNKDKCKIIFENDELELNEYFYIKDHNNNILNKLKIKLKYINNITNMSHIFDGCRSLSSLSDISKWNTNNVTNMSSLFYDCSSLSSLRGISKWNTNNVTDMSYMLFGCKSLSSLPDISKWNTNNVTDMSSMFDGCKSLSSLPDISKWNTNNITNMSSMFSGCTSLSSLPDISKWNIKNVTDISSMFEVCSSLSSLPDISKWKIKNVIDMSYMFSECKKRLKIPTKFKYNYKIY